MEEEVYSLVIPNTIVEVFADDIRSIGEDMRGIHPMYGPHEARNYEVRLKNNKTVRVEHANPPKFKEWLEKYKKLKPKPVPLTLTESLLTQILAELKTLNAK
jgi:prephenate dehydrogenase